MRLMLGTAHDDAAPLRNRSRGPEDVDRGRGRADDVEHGVASLLLHEGAASSTSLASSAMTPA